MTHNLHDLLATLHPDQSSEQIMRKVENCHSHESAHAGDGLMEIGQEFGRVPNWLRLVKMVS